MPFQFAQTIPSIKASTSSNLPLKCGWFLIQFLTTLSSIQFKQFQQRYNLTLETKYQINSYSYEQYLTTFQVEKLLNDPLVSLKPLFKDLTRNLKQKLALSNKCLIRSIHNWSPLDSSIDYKKISSDIYIVKTSCSHLSNDRRIKSMNNYKPRKLLNRYLTGFIQSGSEEGVFENGSYVSPHPFYDIGIHGENQIISITDSGVDVLHNFFYDPKYNKIQVNRTYSDHRKIYAYYSVADSTDVEQGHGTHVSGIALGEALDSESSISLYNGVAPKAKLFFLDIGDSSDEESLSGEFEGDEIYKLMSQKGVSICSNSWGYDSSGDTHILTVEYDKYAYDNPEMLFVFASGNEGSDDNMEEAYIYYTVNSPGDSKNCLSIGSTKYTRLSTIEDERDWVIEIDGKYILSADPEDIGTDPWEFTLGSTKIKQNNLSIHFYNKETSPKISTFKDTIVYLENDMQNFCQNAKEVAGKGATAIIHPNTFYLPDCSKSSKILNASYIKNSKEKFKKSKINSKYSFDYEYFYGYISIPVFSLTDSIDQNSKLASIIPKPTASFDDDNMAISVFSSLGPSVYGINKPDIVVPGEYVISAQSASHTNKNPLPATYDTLMAQSGTSMATPAAAGLAALARQYFTDGFYPSRKSNSNDASLFKSITSTFIRAVLINSAKPFDLIKNIAVSPSGPNIRTGFGVPNLSDALLLNPLRVVRNNQIRSNEKHNYPLNVQYKNGTELKVTMAFIDPPISEESTVPHFADLNLHLVSPSGRLFTGNGYKNNQTEMSNTIERIIVPSNEIEIGLYQIIVTSTNFSDDLVDKINYSIVVNGPFDHFDFENNPAFLQISNERSCLQTSENSRNCQKCDVGCLNNGVCDTLTGRCKCDSNHVGFDCAIEVQQFALQKEYSLNLIPNEIIYAKIPIGFYNDQDKPTITASSNIKDAVYRISLSDKLFYSFSDPNVDSIIADGYRKISVPISLTGTEEEIKNSVLYFAFHTNSPEKITLNFKLTAEPVMTVSPTEPVSDQPENMEHQSIEENSLISNIFLFLIFVSVILIIISITYIVMLFVYRYRLRHQPILTG